MNEECPNCRQLTNTSFSRLVKDSCGHSKCRMCLLYEEHGCRTCNNERAASSKESYGNTDSEKQESNSIPFGNKDATSNEEIVFPLELVINKNSKLKPNDFQLISTDCTVESESHHKSAELNNTEKVYESFTTDTNNDANNVDIPKIEPDNVVLNIHTQLNNANNTVADFQPSYNDVVSDANDADVKSEISNKEKLLKIKPLKSLERTHISVIPGTPERYKCNICSKIFRNKKGKCYHDACITGIKPYQCTFCDRSFVKRSHFEYHERVHSGYKPFKCKLCDKAFPQQNKLNRHMYSHSKEKQFVCPKCNKGYAKRDDLKNHLTVHNGAAAYSCKVCGKAFRILTNLKRHMRTHTSERPHVCDQCNKSFKDKSLLIRHKRTHGKERPFSCAHCNRVFLSKSELRRHLTVHSDEKPFSCEYCQTVFRRKDNLNRHIKHHHSEDSFFEPNKLQKSVEDTSTKLGKTKQITPKQKQKPKKPQRVTSNSLPRSPRKISVVYVNSLDQINSRLDSMGNITPVIRTTHEMSNAVPVINGPISIRKPEDPTGKREKTFIYTEPIPPAEAVVINRRIEEKLYPQNVTGHHYFSRSCLDCPDKTYFTLMNASSRTNSNLKTSTNFATSCETSTLDSMSQTDADVSCRSIRAVQFSKTDKEASEYRNKSNDRLFVHKSSSTCTENIIRDNERDNRDVKQDGQRVPIKEEQANCVSTIKKRSVHVGESEFSEDAITNNRLKMVNNASLPKKPQELDEEKQSKVHWRRRTAEILKPSSQ